ncbi:MAG: SOS response-associated peptidase, partial [Acidobacteria bacterium]|nr:SOS response-associated peptidase [Acidobacteriota bacterium]
MCGRYSIAVEPTEVEERLQASFAEHTQPRFNAAPSQRLPVILNTASRTIFLAPWGLKPDWMSRAVKKGGLINVRLETLRDKRTFRSDLAERRCLVPADGFYEWKTLPDGKKVPFRITRTDGKLFAFAGIWQERLDAGSRTPHFAVITTAANELMQPIHSRMPVILDAGEEADWLASAKDVRNLIRLLETPPSLDMCAYEVSRSVNRVAVDTPE